MGGNSSNFAAALCLACLAVVSEGGSHACRAVSLVKAGHLPATPACHAKASAAAEALCKGWSHVPRFAITALPLCGIANQLRMLRV